MDTVLVEFELGLQHYEKLETAARALHLSADEVVRKAVVDCWTRRSRSSGTTSTTPQPCASGTRCSNWWTGIYSNWFA